VKIEDRLFLNRYRVDTTPHIRIKETAPCLRCQHKQCTLICPADVYKWDAAEQRIILAWENCVETGTCLVACNEWNNIEMVYPRGGFGILYRYG